MYCNYVALADYEATLNRNLNILRNALNSIESSLKVISSTSNWNSETRDYFTEKCESIYDNIDILNNKFLNIIQYLDTVIDNYSKIDSKTVL